MRSNKGDRKPERLEEIAAHIAERAGVEVERKGTRP
jgi:hypothetical protein